MIVDEELYLSYQIDDFLEHHGVKGQKWGVTNAKTIGRGTVKTAKAIARGTEATAKVVGKGTKKAVSFTRAHSELVGSVAAGVLAAGIILKSKHNTKLITIARNKGNFYVAKSILDNHQSLRLSQLGKLAGKTAPGSPVRKAAFKEMVNLTKSYSSKLNSLAVANNVDIKSLT